MYMHSTHALTRADTHIHTHSHMYTHTYSRVHTCTPTSFNCINGRILILLPEYDVLDLYYSDRDTFNKKKHMVHEQTTICDINPIQIDFFVVVPFQESVLKIRSRLWTNSW